MGRQVADVSSFGDDLGKSLTQYQVKLRTSKHFKQMVASCVLFAIFVDILGTCVIVPGLASMCAYAEGGTGQVMLEAGYTQEAVDEFVSPHAFRDPEPPLKFSLAMNVILSAGSIGSALGSAFWGRLADKIGCKLPIQICLLGGIGGYVAIYAAAIWVKSYYLFAAGYVWNNFFGAVADLAFTYFGNIFDGEEKDMYQQLATGMTMVGASLAGFIVMGFSLSPKNAANYFNAFFLAMGLTVVALVGVTLMMVPPAEKKDDDIKEDKPKPLLDASEEMAPRAIKICKILILASALDSGGDEGTRMARSTVLSVVYPEWVTTGNQNNLLIMLIGVAIATMVLLNLLRKVTSLSVIAVIGCSFTLATQLALILEWDSATTYLIIWSFGKMFGYLSTFSQSIMISETVPKSQLGYWNGLNNSASNLVMAATPLIFSTVYSELDQTKGDNHGPRMLATTASVSLLATLAYAPLIALMPKPQKKMTLELEDLESYEKMTDAEWQKLPLEITDQVSAKMIEKGQLPRMVHWGDYHEERPHLHDLQDRAGRDFEYLSQVTTRMLSDRPALAQEQQLHKKFMDMMPKVDRDKAMKEMGMWMANYFDDAGYINWETQSQIYKAMIMTAFPPIDALDEKKPEYQNMTVQEFEHNATKFLNVMDSHLATDRRNREWTKDVGMWTTLAKRR